MPDFTQTSVSMSAKRLFTAPITDAAVFDGVITTLLADTTMGLSKKERGSENYTIKVEYFDAAGESVATVSAAAETRTLINAARTYLTSSAAAVAIAGTDAEAAELTSKATWNARVSCALGEDTFVVSLNRDSMIVSGYAQTATLAAVETWADSVEALC